MFASISLSLSKVFWSDGMLMVSMMLGLEVTFFIKVVTSLWMPLKRVDSFTSISLISVEPRKMPYKYT